MSIGHSFLRKFNPDTTLPDYETKRKTDNVSDIKTFDACVETAKIAKETIITKGLARDRYIRDAEQQLIEMDEEIDRQEKCIESQKTHIIDILRRAWPNANIDWGEPTPPDALEDHVFEAPQIPEEEK